ncbi:hypothetical protein RF11_06485 [Thelohanellus kitauei]|uniref:DDE-1 domain-containing protein n=1 Tax=Thelohanellus kitauei TaxID=669202 RepID=A0A0C2JXX3_THEKT|nr:hypothetical protein RF11_06485 [Thelohanellus kitauei]
MDKQERSKKTSGVESRCREALDQWFSIVSGKCVNINGLILKGKRKVPYTINTLHCMVKKKAIDYINVLCSKNMSGTDKRKQLIIGKSARPRCFKRLRMEGFPVEYHANKNA